MAFRGVPCCLPVLRCGILSGSLCGCPGIPVARVAAIRAGSRYELHCPLVCHGIPQLWESRPTVPVLCILCPCWAVQRDAAASGILAPVPLPHHRWLRARCLSGWEPMPAASVVLLEAYQHLADPEGCGSCPAPWALPFPRARP